MHAGCCIAERGWPLPQIHVHPPGAEVYLDVSGGSDCTGVFSMDEIHSLYEV
jgi:hypothetical protein